MNCFIMGSDKATCSAFGNHFAHVASTRRGQRCPRKSSKEDKPCIEAKAPLHLSNFSS